MAELTDWWYSACSVELKYSTSSRPSVGRDDVISWVAKSVKIICSSQPVLLIRQWSHTETSPMYMGGSRGGVQGCALPSYSKHPFLYRSWLLPLPSFKKKDIHFTPTLFDWLGIYRTLFTGKWTTGSIPVSLYCGNDFSKKSYFLLHNYEVYARKSYVRTFLLKFFEEEPPGPTLDLIALQLVHSDQWWQSMIPLSERKEGDKCT